MADTDVLIAGAGPIGLTAAVELARRGVDIRIVDPIYDPPSTPKPLACNPAHSRCSRVVGRTVRSAREGIGVGDREIQLALIKVALPHLAIRLNDAGDWERCSRSASSRGSPSPASC